MKPIIDSGRLYIAQPPLYRLKKGNSTVYKKDDTDLEDYLIEEGLKNTKYEKIWSICLYNILIIFLFKYVYLYKLMVNIKSKINPYIMI